MEQRPTVFQPYNLRRIDDFINELQEAIDTGDADLFNKRFAKDVLWGSPFAAIVSGYDQIHAIHERMFSAVKAGQNKSIYKIDYAGFLAKNVAVAYVRRTSSPPNYAKDAEGGFDELAIFILVYKNKSWWLAAAQHVPDRRNVYIS
ncbi:hypothetical protein [Chitinophaga eiseniae]|uniref:DUF4440 domain-containing protein n=1 Tax=Chitinophaga eiseniae TaxID=634771 RepID=A0A847STK2_9BACT|nr:hypothetical protein [Chitinophaga eiseniae]NLR81046.1 hypothetical protein [Chitinophaga eiseniae]